MRKIDHDEFMQAWREARHSDGSRIVFAEYELVMEAIAGRWQPPSARTDEPEWLAEARRCMGRTEIPGPRHNSWIAQGWARLGAKWFNDDETPWCGFFVAHCIDAAGIPIPKPSLFPRAKAWLDWGLPCRPKLGSIVVFGRSGGGHVGFLVGKSADNWYVLGGNQRNAVNIMPIAKSRTLGYRWPASDRGVRLPLPRMSGGIVSRNEA